MKHTWIVAMLAVCALGSSAFAGISDWNCTDDGDGAIDMTSATWTDNGLELGIPLYTLDMSAVQNDYPAHMVGDFTVDGDPKVWIIEEVENNTTFAWTDYHIAIAMTQTFSITSALAPDMWTFSITQPVAGTVGNITGYVGYVNYLYGGSGTEIAIGDSGDFGLKIQFDGTVAFCTEQIPTPEPASLTLIGMGALALLRRRG